jgi:hypothetical protein
MAEGAVGLYVVYDDGLAVLSYLVADGGFDFQFAAFSQAEVYTVTDGATHPSLGGHASDGNEAHARHPADDIQNFRDSTNLLDGVYFGFNVNRHTKLYLGSSL